MLVIAAAMLLQTGCRERPAGAQAVALSGRPERIDFNEHIRPILNENCVACHGGVKMAGDISFVFREEAVRSGESGQVTIRPGDPDGSELIARITSRDPEKRMPPVDHGDALAPEQIELFRQWIAEGAPWSEHWAFVTPKPPVVPAVAALWRDKPAVSGATNPIDAFILARLEKEKLAPSPAADRPTLLRRLSLDLTGLPPTPADVGAFAADRADDAYERQVDRLLASPHYGERWASLWLDLARYADTRGYEADRERLIWKYRDWLVDALNRNLPYDRFVIEQLAGDLIPDASLEQRIATAFHRNTLTNDEGGTDDEEFRVAAVLDRVATTWQALNGVTFSCVQCHSHPYDPIRHQEYYSFMAFFNNTVDADFHLHEYPTARIPDDPSRYDEADRLQRTLRELRHENLDSGRSLVADDASWHRLPITAAEGDPPAAIVLRGGEAFAEGTFPTDTILDFYASADGSGLTALRVEVPPLDPAKVRYTPERGFVVARIDAWVVGADGVERPVAVRRFFADTVHQPVHPQAAKAKMPAGPAPPEFYFAADPVLQRTRWVVGALAEPLDLSPGSTLKVRLSHNLNISSHPAIARRVRLSASTDPRWHALAADPAVTARDARIADLVKQREAIPGTELPVMVELSGEERRETRVFARGNWLDKEGPPLEPGVPAVFPPLPPDAEPDRLALARWFFGPEQPLTARVAVNRFWEQLFGIGLVETLEDFGSVGEPPSHPELLDWLALHFQHDLQWDMKALLRDLVMSATYRQSGRATPELLARDPRNRLTAEMVRDQALAASGLLNPQLHGAPVMPPQPEGVWVGKFGGFGGQKTWVDATGADRHRRALYTYLKRTSTYPSLITFDTPSRDLCAVRRVPTNTPLQALVTLNDPVYAEAAEALARRMCAEGGADLRGQLVHGFRLAATRAPAEGELQALLALQADALELLRADAAPDSGDPAEAALTAVASAILNLDAVLTK